MDREALDPERPARTLGEHLEQVLAECLPAEHVPLVFERIRDFYGDAFGVLDFPPAITVGAGPQHRSLRVRLIWPAALAPSERQRYEDTLREAFDRSLAAPLAKVVFCALTFADSLPPRGDPHLAYVGPRRYEEFVANVLATRRGAERSPETAREIFQLVQSYPQNPKEARRKVADRLRDLAARLRSA